MKQYLCQHNNILLSTKTFHRHISFIINNFIVLQTFLSINKFIFVDHNCISVRTPKPKNQFPIPNLPMQLRLRPSVSSKQQDGKDKVISGWLDVPRGWERKVWAQDSFVQRRIAQRSVADFMINAAFLSAPWRRSIPSGIHDYTSREFCGVDG